MTISKSLFFSLLIAVCSAGDVDAQTTIVDFEDVGSSLAADTAYRGEDLAGQFTSGVVEFANNYNPMFDSWNGASYSNRTSWTLGGGSGFEEFQFGNDTVVASDTGSGTGVDGSDTWGVMFGFAPNEARFSIDSGFRLQSLSVNNTRTTAHVIENGNSAATPFDDDSFFQLVFNSIRVDVVNGEEEVSVLASSDPIDLAVGTSIVRDWISVEDQLQVAGFENASTIGLEFRSSDVGMFGINTPTYVAIDNLVLVAVPEPGSALIIGLSGVLLLRRQRR